MRCISFSNYFEPGVYRYEYWEGSWTKEAPGGDACLHPGIMPTGGTYRVALTACRTQPSDPYSSHKQSRRLDPGSGPFFLYFYGLEIHNKAFTSVNVREPGHVYQTTHAPASV